MKHLDVIFVGERQLLALQLLKYGVQAAVAAKCVAVEQVLLEIQEHTLKRQ
tara:strand:- start:610 stop:762 length:153 start_codon:yes stop_codon:yes gene_type:complete